MAREAAASSLVSCKRVSVSIFTSDGHPPPLNRSLRTLSLAKGDQNLVLHVLAVYQGLYGQGDGGTALVVGQHPGQLLHAGDGLAVKLGDDVLFF